MTDTDIIKRACQLALTSDDAALLRELRNAAKFRLAEMKAQRAVEKLERMKERQAQARGND